jgi:hypothetical protein
LRPLLHPSLTNGVNTDLDEAFGQAVAKFQNRAAQANERRDAVRGLADILESLRPRLREVITRRDESDLFEIANRFGVRHKNDLQQTDYDKAIWHELLFYHYAAMIRACIQLLPIGSRQQTV